ncbi:MAG: 2-phosphosulfolactate phosphatase [Ignavibacteria bacterium]|jgi:2-phosphosulfolactate phosphatase|nr:2-phosphosulfolactate phosphatase [Ignavibacteria bacterium]MDP3830968.1 2-phosphosulfolactate phosphatase [Ignavibacteriaceae bacterium]
MKINVIISPPNVDELYFTGKTTVIIDVLRASTTIITALANGAKEIVPVSSVEFAMKASGSMFGGQTLLGGERNTKMIDGFNLGNSPLEYIPETISGKSIILYTSNGSRAIVKSKFSENSIICSFQNLSAVAHYLVELNNNVEILCSGRNGVFSLEDTICAGKLVTELSSLATDVELTDSSLAALTLAKSLGKNLKKMMTESEHGKILIENGFEEDIKYCSKLNTIPIIPIFSANVIKILQHPKTEAVPTSET